MHVANPLGVVAQCLLGHNFDLRYPGAYEAQRDESQGPALLDKMLKGSKPADIPVEAFR